MADDNQTQSENIVQEEVISPETVVLNNETESISANGSEPSDMPPEAPEAPTPVVDMPPVTNTTPIFTPQPTSNPIPASTGFLTDLLARAKAKIQERKRKKLDKITELLSKKDKISNDDVQKLLYVSDATATRYLSILEKENKIAQAGRTGKSVFYTKI